MMEYIFAVDETKSIEGTEMLYKGQIALLATPEVTEVATPELPELERTAKRKIRLEEYEVGAAPSVIDKLVEPRERITTTINNILNLLDSLKEDLSNLTEVEVIFSNIKLQHNELWKLRRFREKAYSEVLVLVESCIKYYDLTELTIEKIDILKEIFGELRLASLLSSYPKECRKKLLKVGFDIFKPFEGVPNKYIVEIKR